MAGTFGNFMSLGENTRFNRIAPLPIQEKPIQKDLLYRNQVPAVARPLPLPIAPVVPFDPFANLVVNKPQQQPQGKQVRLPSGEMAVFPADMPDDAITNNITQFQTQQQRVQEFDNQHPLAKGLMQLVGPQFGFQPPTKDEFQIPVVPGNTFGMTPETLNSTLGVIQNTQNMNAAERIRQRVQLEKEMEQEKDRAQQLKLEQQRMKNEQMMEKMRLQLQKQQEEAKGKQGTIYMGKDGQPIWAGMNDMGQPTARAITVEGASTQPTYKHAGFQDINLNGKLTTVQVLTDESGKTKLQTIGDAPGSRQDVELITTQDANGNPVQMFVTPEAGKSYLSAPKEGRGAATEFQNWQMQEAKRKQAQADAYRQVAAESQTDPELGEISGDSFVPTIKGLKRLEELAKQRLNGGVAGNTSPANATIDRQTGIRIID